MASATVVESAAQGLAQAQVMEAQAEALKKQGDAEAQIIERKNLAEARGLEVKAEANEKAGYREANVREKQGEAEAKVVLVTAQADAQRIHALAEARERDGMADAKVLEAKALADAKRIEAEGTAEAKRIQAIAVAKQQDGEAEAKVVEMKGLAEAKKIEAQAEAMKKLEGVGREHEEFKLRLAAEKEIRLQQINVQKDIAESQAIVLSEALKSAKIDIIGGETKFFEQITSAVSRGRSIDAMVDNSKLLSGISNSLLKDSPDGSSFLEKVRGFVQQLGLGSEDVKNLSISALILQLRQKLTDPQQQSVLYDLLIAAQQSGLGALPASQVLSGK
jgi:hypothetical protein